MCFIHDDYEWLASVEEETERTAGAELKCGECYRIIPVGATYHHIYQQEMEHGDCFTCENGDCECPEGRCCNCVEPDCGQTFDFDYCHDCHLFLAAVKAAEIEAGCHINESRPSLGGMLEEIGYGPGRFGMQDAKRYFKKALATNRDLKPYLGWLWRRMFV